MWIEIGPNRPARFADLVRLICLEAMQAVAVLVGVDRHGLDIELIGGPETLGSRSRRDWLPKVSACPSVSLGVRLWAGPGRRRVEGSRISGR